MAEQGYIHLHCMYIQMQCLCLVLQDGGLDSYDIANIERNELKNRTQELEEELAAKKAALKQISRENADLKGRLELLLQDQSGASVIKDLSRQVEELKESLQMKQSILQDINKENQDLREKLEQGDQSRGVLGGGQAEELKVKQEALDVLNKTNEQLQDEIVALKKQSSGTQGSALQSDFSELENLKGSLREKEQALEMLQRENSDLNSRLNSLDAGEGAKGQGSSHKVDELSKMLWEKESEIGNLQHLKAQLEERLGSFQNVQNELEESRRQCSMLEAQLANQGAADQSFEEKSEVENLRENLRLKQETMEQLNRENEELKERLSTVESTDLKELLEESYKKLQQLSEELSAKNEQLEKLQPMQSELEQTKVQTKELEQQVSFLKHQLEVAEDNSLSESSQIENLKENLKIKQETVQQLSKENEELRLKVEDASEGSRLLEDMKAKVEDLTTELDAKKEERNRVVELQGELEQSKAKTVELQKEVSRLQHEVDTLEDNSQSESSLMENLKENLKIKQQTVEQLSKDNDAMQDQLSKSQATLAQMSEQLMNKQNELDTVMKERDEKLMQVMDQFAEKEEALENFRKNNELMKSQLKQVESDVSILFKSVCDRIFYCLNQIFFGEQGWRSVRALAFHQCGPGSIPGLGVISGLSLLVLYSAPRGFSPGTLVFPSLQKPRFDLI